MMHGLNRKKGEEREENDFYATHPSAVAPLIKFLGWEAGGKTIWENSCGKGHLSIPLEMYGHKVVSTDLIDRDYGVPGIDFLQPTPFDNLKYDAVIMNPPYKFALEFVQKSLTVAPVVCAFLRLAFLESSRRRKFFEDFPPRYVAVFRERVPCSKNALFPEKESNPTAYAWFIWEKGFKGKPEIVWF